MTVTAVVPQVLPLLLLRVTVGGLIHPHDTEKGAPKVMHPAAFLTVIKQLLLLTDVKTGLVWYAPPLRLYSRPAPIGLVTVTTA